VLVRAVQLYWQKRQSEMSTRQKEAEERKAKYMKVGAGVGLTVPLVDMIAIGPAMLKPDGCCQRETLLLRVLKTGPWHCDSGLMIFALSRYPPPPGGRRAEVCGDCDGEPGRIAARRAQIIVSGPLASQAVCVLCRKPIVGRAMGSASVPVGLGACKA
jgi:hypothetical protein